MLTVFLVGLGNFPPILSALITGVILLIVTKAIFALYDSANPKPSNLSMDEVKTFFSSKIFWLSLFTFVATTAKGLFGIDIDLDTQNEVLNLDWTNVIPALGSVLIIAVRKFDILKLLIN